MQKAITDAINIIPKISVETSKSFRKNCCKRGIDVAIPPPDNILIIEGFSTLPSSCFVFLFNHFYYNNY
jgi:hypothetical protein